jgi:hypothetical protein
MIAKATISHKNTSGLVPGKGLYPAARHLYAEPDVEVRSPRSPDHVAFSGTCVRWDYQGHRDGRRFPRGGSSTGEILSHAMASLGLAENVTFIGDCPVLITCRGVIG